MEERFHSLELRRRTPEEDGLERKPVDEASWKKLGLR
jgi:hypothetical protein